MHIWKTTLHSWFFLLHEWYLNMLERQLPLLCSFSVSSLQSKQIKVLQGYTSKTLLAFCMNTISANVRNHRAQETQAVGSDSSKSSVSVRYQSKLSMHVIVHSCSQSIVRRRMQSKMERLELVPCQSCPQLSREKERCQQVEKGNAHKWYCKCEITQCEKCKSTAGN